MGTERLQAVSLFATKSLSSGIGFANGDILIGRRVLHVNVHGLGDSARNLGRLNQAKKTPHTHEA
jgi:hypothetical protein